MCGLDICAGKNAQIYEVKIGLKKKSHQYIKNDLTHVVTLEVLGVT